MRTFNRRIRINDRFVRDEYTEWVMNEKGYYVARTSWGPWIEMFPYQGEVYPYGPEEQSSKEDTDDPTNQ